METTTKEISIPEVSDLEVAFGTVKGLPEYASLPREFKDLRTPWNTMFSKWFFGGISGLELEANEGVDLRRALKHLRACMASFQPKHEHKEAGCAYLMSRYFKSAKWDGGSAA